MNVTRQWRTWPPALLAVAILSLVRAPGAGADAAAPDALVGAYRHVTVSPAGNTRRSVATIAPRGAGLSIAWEEDEGNLFGGVGISLDGVFGAAYTEALNGTFRGEGVLAYRISGGTLTGVRLSYDSADGALIQETLQGSPALEGRYAIVRSVDATGDRVQSGHVDIEHRGDTYQMTWFTPEHAYDGVGLRVGDVLIAGYAHGFAPSVAAYCADEGLLTGIVTFGAAGTIGADRLRRINDGRTGTAAEPSARCRAAIEKWNPSLERH